MMNYGRLQNIEKCYLQDNNKKIPQFAGFFVLSSFIKNCLVYCDYLGKNRIGLKKKNYFCTTT